MRSAAPGTPSHTALSAVSLFPARTPPRRDPRGQCSGCWRGEVSRARVGITLQTGALADGAAPGVGQPVVGLAVLNGEGKWPPEKGAVNARVLPPRFRAGRIEPLRAATDG